jgi:hypothetical protein
MLGAWRFAPMTAIVLLPWIVEELESMLPVRPLGNPVPALAALLLLNTTLSGGIGLKEGSFPLELQDQLPGEGRLWHDHLYGGWLVHQGVEVFWDGRNDCYPEEVFEEGVRVAFVQPGWEGVMDKWGVGAVLTRREPLVAALKAAGWRVRAQSEAIYLLERD